MKHSILRITLCTIALVATTILYAQTYYDFTVKDGDSIDFNLSQLKGKVVLVVNTATRCGLTPQYEGLQQLYSKYHEQGLEILDFPCNQFLNQAPGSNAKIRQFCKGKYNTTFSQMAKLEVNGENTHPLYVFLKNQKGQGEDIKWNFEKFLIDRNGNVVARFSPKTKPAEIEQQIVELLKAK